MSDDKTTPKQKVAWSSIFSTIATGLLLAAFNYGFSLIATYLFSDRADIYFVERPMEARRFQKLVVIDNFSSNVLNELQFTITAGDMTIASQVNLEKVEQTVVAPGTLLVKVFGLLPNRQASFMVLSDRAVPDDSFRPVKVPLGLRYKSKDRLSESWFDVSQLISALIQFLIYVLGMWYFERRLAHVSAQAGVIETQFEKRKVEVEDLKQSLEKIRLETLKRKLVLLRRTMTLTRENRLWRETVLGVLQQGAKDQNAAKRLLGVIFTKAGIRLDRTLDELDDEELVNAIEEAKSELALSQV